MAPDKTPDEPDETEMQLARVIIAARKLKLAIRDAVRLMWVDRHEAERELNRAISKAEEDGI